MKYCIYGPFDLPRTGNGLIDTAAARKKTFWQSVEAQYPGLPGACGCYVMAIKARRGTLPWYVGRTTKRTFKVETFGTHQVNHYNNALGKKVAVQPQLFLLAKKTQVNRFAKPSVNSHADIEFLETFLFGIALNRNPNLCNAKNTRFLKTLVLPGVINSPRRRLNKHELAMRSVLGL